MNFISHAQCFGHFAQRGRLAVKFLLLLALCLATSNVGRAQAKRSAAPASQRAFSIPCPRALKIGLDEVERLYDQDQARRYKGDTDSGTEGDATRGALRNYLSCRRNDNLARLKQLDPSTRTALNKQTASAKSLAQTRFQLINGIAFDEHAEDPINYGMTQRALALIEDYKGELITALSQHDQEPVGKQRAAERDEQSLTQLLARLESKASDADDAEDYRRKLASLKQAIDKFQIGNANVHASAKGAATRFILALIKLGLPD